MVRRDDLAKASGISQTANMVGMLVAPALAGVLVGQFGTRLPLLLDAGSYLGLVVAGLLIRTRRSGRLTEGTTRVAWRLRDDRLIATMVAALAACVAGWARSTWSRCSSSARPWAAPRPCSAWSPPPGRPGW